MALVNSEGIVLRVRDLGEADRLLTILGDAGGKYRAVARGARRPRNRLVAAAQPFVHARFSLFKGSGLHAISQCEVKESFRGLREDLSAFAHASYAVELVDEFAREGDEAQALFYTLLNYLHLLAAGRTNPLLRRAFELRMLDIGGFKPQFEACAACGRAVAENPVPFGPAAGGLLCPACAGKEATVVVGRDTVAAANMLLRLELSRAGTVHCTEKARAELGRLLDRHLLHRLGRSLKTLSFLTELSATEVSPDG
ncbi:MAG: DNA repair protein RecO [Bacillota bacterium]